MWRKFAGYFEIRYIRERNIIWKHLENGCRKKQVIHDICISLNEELKQKIYLPFDEKEEVEVVEKELELLKEKNFYQFGQRVIYKLLITYGFKEKVIINNFPDILSEKKFIDDENQQIFNDYIDSLWNNLK